MIGYILRVGEKFIGRTIVDNKFKYHSCDKPIVYGCWTDSMREDVYNDLHNIEIEVKKVQIVETDEVIDVIHCQRLRKE